YSIKLWRISAQHSPLHNLQLPSGRGLPRPTRRRPARAGPRELPRPVADSALPAAAKGHALLLLCALALARRPQRFQQLLWRLRRARDSSESILKLAFRRAQSLSGVGNNLAASPHHRRAHLRGAEWIPLFGARRRAEFRRRAQLRPDALPSFSRSRRGGRERVSGNKKICRSSFAEWLQCDEPFQPARRPGECR